MQDFFKSYFEYALVGKSEPPALFHRWTAVSIVAALLGRNSYLPFGHSKVFPNQYIMLMGSPGTRKSSALNVGVNLLRDTGYNRFSSDSTSKQRMLMDMKQTDALLIEQGVEALTLDEPSEIFVAIGEFTDFIGMNNMDFVTMLTNLYDCPNSYSNPKITSTSVEVHKPVVNILGGNTAQGFALAFPPEALGNGFLSRLILVHGETSGRKVTFPPAPDLLLKANLINHLKEVKISIQGEFSITKEAQEVCDVIYNSDIEIDDARFRHYQQRRFAHLLKISLAISASDLRMTVGTSDILKANTLLYNTERKMPKALGEFGKSKNSDVNNAIMEILNIATKPLTVQDLFKKVSQDISKQTDLIEVMKNLTNADKIEIVSKAGRTGYVTKQKEVKQWDKSLLVEDWLTMEELA